MATDFAAVREKRLEQEQARRSSGLHQESIAAVTKSGQTAADATKNLANRDDIAGLLKQMKDVQLTTMLAGVTAKPSIVLTDQTDLGDKLTEAIGKVSTTISQLNSSDVDNKQLTTLGELKAAIEDFNKKFADNSDKQNRDLLAAVHSLELSPVVNVPEPKVTINEKAIDFGPLQDTIREYFMAPETESEKVDLECFRAQDISEADGKQYVGFVNPEGQWYIIENDVPANRLRYVFGQGDYTKAFNKASGYQYLLLNEAIDAL